METEYFVARWDEDGWVFLNEEPLDYTEATDLYAASLDDGALIALVVREYKVETVGVAGVEIEVWGNELGVTPTEA